MMSACLAVPAMAQQDQGRQRDSQQRDRQQDRDRDAQDRDSQYRGQQARDSQDRDQRGSQQARYRLNPMGQVIIGFDTDGDNRYDAFESVYYYDLERAIRSSAQRRAQEAQRRQGSGQQQFAQSQQRRQGQPQSQQSRQSQSQSQQGRQDPRSQQRQQAQQRQGGQQRQQGQQGQQQLAKVSGTVTATSMFRLSDGPEHHFIKIETQDGNKIPVDLGRIDQVRKLDLEDGDKITVHGVRTRVNDKRILCARRIQVGDKTMSVGRERDRDLKRVRGEISSVSTKRFKGKDQEFEVAKVKLQGDRTETVILGPAERLKDLDLEQGDRVQLLVRSGRYNDEPALIADQIRSGNKSVNVSKPEGQRFQSRQAQR